MARQKILRSNTKDTVIILVALVGIAMFTRSSFFFWSLVTALFYYNYLFYMKTDLYLDDFMQAKKKLWEYVMASYIMIVGFLWMLFSVLKINDGEASYGVMIYGAALVITSAIGMKGLGNFNIKKKEKDFNNLKQEYMYDDVKVKLADAFSHRIKTTGSGKKTKEWIDLQGLDIQVVDIYRDIKEDIFLEIRYIVNMEESMRDSLPYFLTKYNSKEEIEEGIKELQRPVLDGSEKNKFIRYVYQLLKMKIEENKRAFDIEAKIKEFDGVLEYAILDMYTFVADFKGGFKNVPIGNMLAYTDPKTEGNMYSRHLCGAMDSISMNEIVGRYGIGFYTGYHLFLEGVKLDKREEIQKENEFKVMHPDYKEDEDVYMQKTELLSEFL